MLTLNEGNESILTLKQIYIPFLLYQNSTTPIAPVVRLITLQLPSTHAIDIFFSVF